jgi:hypothetical protein
MLEVCHRIIWAIIVDTRLFFDDIKLAEDFLEQGQSMMFPASTLEGEYLSIKHGIIIHCHNFPQDWETPAPQVLQGGYYPRKGGGGGYQPLQPPSGGPPPWQHTPVKPPASGSYKWWPDNWIDERHPKTQAMMEPFLVTFRGRCSVSNIITEGGLRFDALPKLKAYPEGICWLNTVALCPYGGDCSFVSGNLPKGTITDQIANQICNTLQPGVTAMLNRSGPPSPITGKCKWPSWGRGRGGGGGAPATQLM